LCVGGLEVCPNRFVVRGGMIREHDLKALTVFCFFFIAYSLVGYILTKEYDNPASRIGLAMLSLYFAIHLYNVVVFFWNKFWGIKLSE
tara:strand:+ start:17 stop:280 length:264 start_codon:yes stop_codon:yes gene_type:complete